MFVTELSLADFRNYREASLELTSGVTARIFRLIETAAEDAVRSGKERLDASDTTNVDTAYDEVVAGTVRYRYVIDTSTIPAG